MLRLIVAVLCVTIALLASPALGATLHVPEQYSTIQSAVDAATVGDTVLIAPGTYRGAGNRDVTLAGKDITIASSAGPSATTIDCEGAGRAFSLSDGETTAAVLSGLAIVNGVGGGGGAIGCSGGSSPTIRSCWFAGNATADWGGGGAIWSSGAIVVEDCVFTGNSAFYGGALYCIADLSVARCTFVGNQAEFHGGAVWVDAYYQPVLLDCVFANNSALENGGAICCWDYSMPTIRGCTFWGNGADYGGGIACWMHSEPLIEQCIIACTHSGGAVHCNLAADPLIWRCCVYANTGGGLCGSYWNILELDPVLCGPESDDFTLHVDSPCLPENNQYGVLIGALGQGCGGTPCEHTSWGRLKSLFLAGDV